MPLLVEDLMFGLTKSVIPETSLAEVMSLMQIHHVECLPVTVNKCLVGYVRLKDMLDILLSGDTCIGTETCGEISNLQCSNAAIIRADIRRVIFDKAISVPPSTPVNKAVSLMRMYQVSSLAVTEANELVGLLSLDDINKAITSPAHTRAAA
ncbi:MAG: CBS domain-containing protein [Gammaproteobacteria bacterium]|nr:CBS domain-containing protein [Gammaproteobacteria bacterium]